MRLVSLCPSITETLVALGAGGDLVGVTRYCIHPREALAGVERVGGTKTPDLRRIVALEPDLVFLNAEENRREDAEELTRHLPIDVTHPRRVDEVPGLIRHLGARAGRAGEAEPLAREVEAALAALQALSGPTFRFAYLIWKGPWMAAGPGTYISSLLEAAGGVNVVEGGPYPELSEDALAALRPDVLVLPDEPFRFTEAHRDFWAARLPGCRVKLVPGDDFCWHGVRTKKGLEAARDLARSRPAALDRS